MQDELLAVQQPSPNYNLADLADDHDDDGTHVVRVFVSFGLCTTAILLL